MSNDKQMELFHKPNNYKHGVMSAAKSAEGFTPAHIKSMAEGLDYPDELQAALVKEAEVLVDDMVLNHNFVRKPIPPDIKDWQIRAWRIQKSLAQEEYPKVASALQAELRTLGADAETISSVNTALVNDTFTKKYRDKFLLGLIDDCLNVHRRRAANPRPGFGEPQLSFNSKV